LLFFGGGNYDKLHF